MITRSLLIALVLSAILAIAHAENPPAAKPAPSPMRFMSYDMNPKNPSEVTVGINVNGRTYFKSVGEQLQGTNWELQSFKKKETVKPDGTKADASEITLLDTKTNETKVLSISGVIDGTPRR